MLEQAILKLTESVDRLNELLSDNGSPIIQPGSDVEAVIESMDKPEEVSGSIGIIKDKLEELAKLTSKADAKTFMTEELNIAAFNKISAKMIGPTILALNKEIHKHDGSETETPLEPEAEKDSKPQTTLTDIRSKAAVLTDLTSQKATIEFMQKELKVKKLTDINKRSMNKAGRILDEEIAIVRAAQVDIEDDASQASDESFFG